MLPDIKLYLQVTFSHNIMLIDKNESQVFVVNLCALFIIRQNQTVLIDAVVAWDMLSKKKI